MLQKDGQDDLSISTNITLSSSVSHTILQIRFSLCSRVNFRLQQTVVLNMLIETYTKNSSHHKCPREFHPKFPDTHVPHNSIISKNFCNMQSVLGIENSRTRVHWHKENAERQVFTSNLHTAEELKENIWQEIVNISQKVLSHIFHNIFTTHGARLQADKHPFKHILWFKVQIIWH